MKLVSPNLSVGWATQRPKRSWLRHCVGVDSVELRAKQAYKKARENVAGSGNAEILPWLTFSLDGPVLSN